MEKRRGSCTRSQSLLTQVVDSNVKGKHTVIKFFSFSLPLFSQFTLV